MKPLSSTGANPLQVLRYVIVPLSRPALITRGI